MEREVQALLKNKEVKVLKLLLNIRKQVQIKAKGVSMYPEIVNNADIVIEKSSPNSIGDILVYNYKDEGLLVHRLLATNPTYICKGDNAFRIESILPSDVIGKVISVDGRLVKKWSDWEIELSRKIGILYMESQNAEKVISSSLFKLYATTIFKKNKGYIMYCTEDLFDISYNPLNKSCDCFYKVSKTIRYYGIESYMINFVWSKPKIEVFFDEMNKYMKSTSGITFENIICALIKLLEENILLIK